MSPAPPDAGAMQVRPALERSAEGGRSMPPLSDAARRAVAPEPGEEVSEALPPTAFDRLSEGMVNGLRGTLRTPQAAVDARRPF